MTRRLLVILFTAVVLLIILILILWGLLIHFRGQTQTLSCEEVAERIAAWGEDSPRSQFLRGTGRCQGPVASTRPEDSVYSGPTVRFTIPGGYSPKPESSPRPEEIDTAVYIAGVGGTRRLTVQALRLTIPDNEEFPAIKARRTYPETYSEVSRVLDGQEVLEFTNITTEGFEKVLFRQVNGQITTIAVTSLTAYGKEDAAKEYESVLASLQWQ